MGNAITKKFDAPKDYTGSAGHSQLWKIWPAKSKETGKEVSVWVFDKAELLKRKINNTNATIDKAVVEQIYQIMKKDMTILREICSSSGGVGNIIHYYETIEETTATLIFTTERILCSLADLHSGFEGILPSPKLEEMKREYFSGTSYDRASSCLSDIEISRGLLNISEGLQYLHTVQRKLHLNLTPESIVITQSGQWKLCGLGFSLGFMQGERQQIPSPYFLQSVPSIQTMRLEPDLRYCGPEVTIGGLNPPGIRYLSSSSDVFSLGVIAYESYRYNIDTSLSVTERRAPVVPMSNNSAVYHQTALENVSQLNYNFLPSTALVQLLMDMMQLTPQSRINIQSIMNHPYFSSGPLLVLKLIDSLRTRDVGTQSSQLLTLPSQLAELPDRLLESTILPAICQATMTTPVLLPYAIPTHIYTAQRIAKSKYCSITGPSIIHALETSTSVEVMQALIKYMHFFADIFSPEGSSSITTIEPAMVTLISNCLDKSQTSVHISGFRILCDEKIRAYISTQSLVNKVVPKVCREACKNSDPNVKIHALYVMSLIASRLDKAFIIQNILPSLRYITDNEKNPVVSMCVLGNYNMVAPALGADFIAKNIIPSICPMLVDRSLDKKQFELVGSLMRSMLYKVYEMRASDLGLPGTGSNNIFDREDSGSDLDPFFSAKVMIQNAKKDSNDDIEYNSPSSNGSMKIVSSDSMKAPVKVNEEDTMSKGRLTKVATKKPVEPSTFPPPAPSYPAPTITPPPQPAALNSTISTSLSLSSSSYKPSYPAQEQSMFPNTMNQPSYMNSNQPSSQPAYTQPTATPISTLPLSQQYPTSYPSNIPSNTMQPHYAMNSAPQVNYNATPYQQYNTAANMFPMSQPQQQQQQPSQQQPYSMGMYGQLPTANYVQNAQSKKPSDDPFDFLN